MYKQVNKMKSLHLTSLKKKTTFIISKLSYYYITFNLFNVIFVQGVIAMYTDKNYRNEIVGYVSSFPSSYTFIAYFFKISLIK